MIKTNKECCGCGLCTSVCPKQCIKLEYDDQGFKYPVVNKEICINCSVCYKKCIIFNKVTLNKEQKFYVARALDENILMSSSSGGMFSVLADYVIENFGVVYGACFDNEFNVVHRSARTFSEVSGMKGSKYVQSDICDIFVRIENDLKNDKIVLFSGTPCQAAAISAFLNYKKVVTDRLILIDVICHGVCSEYVWRDYISFIKSRYGKKIKCINMRYKIGTYGYCMKIDTDSCEYIKVGGRDPYIKLFQKNLILRKSCLSCKYKSMDRISDITIGDFRNHKKNFSEFFDSKGCSSVIVNTKKGEKLFDKIKSQITYLEVGQSEIEQLNLTPNIISDKQRESFFNNYEKMDFVSLLKKYTELGFKNRAVAEAKQLIKKIIKR